MKYLQNQYHFSCCLSPAYARLTDTASWYRRIDALPIFACAAPNSQTPYSLYGDFGIFFETGLSHRQLREFVYPPVWKLLHFDEENNTQYVPTLRAYFENGLNQKKTAEKLFLHINTLYYRLNKIAESFHILLEDGNEIFAVAFSLRVIQYMQLERSCSSAECHGCQLSSSE